MRPLLLLALFLTAGCGPTPTFRVPPPSPPASEKPAAVEQETTVAVSPDDPQPPDLGSRKEGVDWPAFLGPTADGVSPEKGVVAPWPAAGPRLVWHCDIESGYSAPVVSRGRLFQFDRVLDRARLRCLNSETGAELWSFDYPTKFKDSYGYNNGPRCCPVVDRDRVYIFGPEGMLHCLRAVDGKLVWKVDTRARFGVVQNFFGVGSTPVVEGDLLLVQVGGSGDASVPISLDLKGDGSGLVAFDKYTGKIKYQATDELASYASPKLATIDGRRWCFLFARGGLVALDPATGAVDFRYPWRAKILESVNASNPVVVGDRVFISETYGPGSAFLKIKPGACEEIWTDADKGRAKSMQCHWMTPIVVDGYLYGSSGRHLENAELRCIELATGKVQWSVRNLTRSSLMLVDGYFVCLNEEGVLRLLKVNPKKYEEVSAVSPVTADKYQQLLLREPCWAAPILSHGLLYVRGKDKLVCLEMIPASKK